MDVTFLAHSGRKRKSEKRVREVPETNIKKVQHRFLTETGMAVSRETMRKYMKMSAKPFKKTRAHFLSDAHKVKRMNWCLDMKRQDRSGARRSIFERQQLGAVQAQTNCEKISSSSVEDPDYL